MARQQMVSFTVSCDVCGTEITEGDAQGSSRKISWDGADYLLDICAADQAALDVVIDQLKTFVDAGSATTASGRSGSPRRAKTKTRAKTADAGSASTPRSTTRRSDLPAIRVWASENGFQVGDRGRIPASIVAAYDQARLSPSTAPAPKKRRSRKAAQVAV